MLATIVLLSAVLTTQEPLASSAEAHPVEAGGESLLHRRAQADPEAALQQLRDLLARSLTNPTTEGARLDSATQLAAVIAAVSGDSFPIIQVAGFRDWPRARRLEKVAADSLRRAGNKALSRRGAGAAIRLWRASITRAAAAADTAGLAAGLGNLGAGFSVAGRNDSAEVYLERSRRLAQLAGDRRTLGNALGLLASVAKDRGELRRAQDLYLEATGVRESVGDTRGLAADLNDSGLVAQELGDLQSAEELYRRALALNERYGRPGQRAANLLNLANLATLRGDYPAAAVRYQEALSIRAERGERWEEGTILHNLGLLATRRGAFGEAVTALIRALAIFRSLEAEEDASWTLLALANVHLSMGDVHGALSELARADSVTSRSGGAARAEWALAGAELSMALNDLAGSERHYRTAARLYRDNGDLAGRAAADEGMALLYLSRDQPARARSLLERAKVLRKAAGDRRALAMTLVLQGYTARVTGDKAVASGFYAEALASFRQLGDPAGEAVALEAAADLAIETGDWKGADSLYAGGLRRLFGKDLPTIGWRLYAGLAGLQEAQGQSERSVASYRAAIREIERSSTRLASEEHRAAFLADKWEVYGRLALLEQWRGNIGEGFNLSERLRARQMLDQLTRGRVAAGKVPAELSIREQDLRYRTRELTLELEARSTTGSRLPLREASGDTLSLGTLQEQLAQVQESYAALLSRIRNSHPDYARLVEGTTVGWRDVARRLAADEVLLEYLVLDSTTVVFVVSTDSMAALDLGVARTALAELVDFARGSLSSAEAQSGKAAWRPPLRRLYRELLAPIEDAGLLAGKRRLVILPHAELHYLPFAALLGGAPETFLVERFELSYSPSASVWANLKDRTTSHAGKEVLAVAPRPADLPASVEEVNAIGRIYGTRARILTGADATESRVKELAPKYGIVHLATLGVLNSRNPLFSFVQLGAEPGEDGRLEVHETYGLDLQADLVVLSACQTGLGSGLLADIPAGDDWIGLVRAFLHTGAANVLATQWRVEDRSTAALMEAFYTRLATGMPAAGALAEAQRTFLSRPAVRDPFYWAGFALSGAGAE
jgi:CHAT domain-containing protein